MTKEKTMLDWLCKRDNGLKKMFQRKSIYNYTMISPVGLDDLPQVYVYVQATKKSKSKRYVIPM